MGLTRNGPLGISASSLPRKQTPAHKRIFESLGHTIFSTSMGQQSKEPCKKQACDIQACLTKNNFNPQRCRKVIELLQSCCEECKYQSTHCASVSDLLKQRQK